MSYTHGLGDAQEGMNDDDGPHYCTECGDTMVCIQEGNWHDKFECKACDVILKISW